MRRFVSFTITFLGVACLQAAFAQGFTGTFVSPEASLSVTLQQGPDGSLSGVVTGPNGQFALQGQSSGPAAYGVVATQQGQLGFQAALSTDGGTLTMELYQTGPNGQPTPAGPALTLLRSGGGALPGGGFAGQAPGQAPGPATGGVPGGMPPQAPGAMLAGVPGQVPGGFPGQAQGGLPGQPAGGFPGQAPGGFPAPPAAPPVGGDWNGTFVGDAGAVVLFVQGGQGAYTGYLQGQGQQYQFQAHLDDQTLHGAFVAGGAQYEFWADRDGANVLLWLGDQVYVLQPAALPGRP